MQVFLRLRSNCFEKRQWMKIAWNWDLARWFKIIISEKMSWWQFVAFMKRLAASCCYSACHFFMTSEQPRWQSKLKMNAFSRSGRRKLINETRNSMIPEVFPMIQSSNDSFLQLERWVKKIHCLKDDLVIGTSLYGQVSDVENMLIHA